MDCTIKLSEEENLVIHDPLFFELPGIFQETSFVIAKGHFHNYNRGYESFW